MLDQFIEVGLRGKSPATIKTYEHAIKQFADWLDGSGTNLEDYGRIDVQQYINFLASRGKSAQTINKIFHAIKKYSTWANKVATVEDINIVKPRNLKNEAPKALSRNELNRVLREIDRTGNTRNLAIVLLLSNSGLRLSELINLDKSDIIVSERKGVVNVRHGKGNKQRQIPLNPESRRAIEKYLEQRSDQDPALFISNQGKRIAARTVQHLIEKYGYHAHALRHTFITNLVRNGEDFSLIQSLSGHESADMVMRYSAPTEEDKRSAIERLNNG